MNTKLNVVFLTDYCIIEIPIETNSKIQYEIYGDSGYNLFGKFEGNLINVKKHILSIPYNNSETLFYKIYINTKIYTSFIKIKLLDDIENIQLNIKKVETFNEKIPNNLYVKGLYDKNIEYLLAGGSSLDSLMQLEEEDCDIDDIEDDIEDEADEEDDIEDDIEDEADEDDDDEDDDEDDDDEDDDDDDEDDEDDEEDEIEIEDPDMEDPDMENPKRGSMEQLVVIPTLPAPPALLPVQFVQPSFKNLLFSYKTNTGFEQKNDKIVINTSKINTSEINTSEINTSEINTSKINNQRTELEQSNYNGLSSNLEYKTKNKTKNKNKI